MALFNNYYPPQDHNYSDWERLRVFYPNYETVTDCVCEDFQIDQDPELCVPSLIILLHQMHQEILSLREEVDKLTGV